MSRDKHLPKFLEDFDLFKALWQWYMSRAGDAPHWRLDSLNSSVRCTLTWKVDGEQLNVSEVAIRAEEAVYRAILTAKSERVLSQCGLP